MHVIHFAIQCITSALPGIQKPPPPHPPSVSWTSVTLCLHVYSFSSKALVPGVGGAADPTWVLRWVYQILRQPRGCCQSSVGSATHQQTGALLPHPLPTGESQCVAQGVTAWRLFDLWTEWAKCPMSQLWVATPTISLLFFISLYICGSNTHQVGKQAWYLQFL